MADCGREFTEVNDDVLWFRQQPKRQCRIRQPLGMHDATRRRVLVWRVPKNNPMRGAVPDGLMRIPFLAEADETIENDDKVLLQILDGLMKAAAEAKPDRGFVVTGAGAFPGWSDG
jgi:hypothetical protein